MSGPINSVNMLFDKAPSMMSVEEFEKVVMPQLMLIKGNGSVTASQDMVNELFRLVGMDAAQGGAALCDIGHASTDKKELPLAKMLKKYRDTKVIGSVNMFRALSFINNKMSFTKATCFDSFKRVSDLGYTQTQMRVDEKSVGEITNFVQANVDAGMHSMALKFVDTQKNKPCIAVRDSAEKLVGIGRVEGGFIDYAISGDKIKPLEFERFNPVHAYLAQLLAHFVAVIKGAPGGTIGNEKYYSNMQLNSVVSKPDQFFQLMNLSARAIIDHASKYIPLPHKGVGADLASWFLRALNLCTDINHTPIMFDELHGMFDTMTGYFATVQVQNHTRFAITRNTDGSSRITIDKFVSALRTDINGTHMIVRGESKVNDAFMIRNARRNVEQEGTSGLSAQSLHYAWGIAAPPEVIDVVTIATDIKLFVEEYNNRTIAIKFPGKHDSGDRLTRCLKALSLAKFTGKVILEGVEIYKILRENAPDKSVVISQYTKSGKFGRSDFDITVGSAGDDVPTWYIANYDITGVSTFDDYEKKYNEAIREMQHNMTAVDYMVNVALLGESVTSATIQSFEAHNMTGYRFSSTAIEAKISEVSKLVTLDKVDKNITFMPCTKGTCSRAYARVILANWCRALYVFTNDGFAALCSAFKMPVLFPCRGNLSGVLSYNVLINGVSIDQVILSRNMMESYLEGGSEEVKQLIRHRVTTLVPASVDAALDATGSAVPSAGGMVVVGRGERPPELDEGGYY